MYREGNWDRLSQLLNTGGMRPSSEGGRGIAREGTRRARVAGADLVGLLRVDAQWSVLENFVAPVSPAGVVACMIVVRNFIPRLKVICAH